MWFQAAFQYLLAHLGDLLCDLLARVLNLLLSSQKHKDVARRLTDMYLHDRPYGCFQVIPFWFLHSMRMAHVQLLDFFRAVDTAA